MATATSTSTAEPTPSSSPTPQRTIGAVAATYSQISAGGSHTCALHTDGTVWCWGEDAFGQIGDGPTGYEGEVRLNPVQVLHGSGNLSGVKAISAGGADTCALVTDGTVWCWGYDQYGQLGDGTTGEFAYARVVTPVQVIQGSGALTSVAAIAASEYHTCALKTDGSVWCWGSDQDGQLGDGSTGDADNVRLKPVQVIQGGGMLTGVTAISAGGGGAGAEFEVGGHTCALKTDGTVWCWGSDYFGQLGDGTTGDQNNLRLAPVQVVQGSGMLTGVAAISAGDYHTCAFKTDGTVWCWGRDLFGQLGDGTTGDKNNVRLTPVQVVQGSGMLTGVAAISAGSDHTCALVTDDTAWCWGYDANGELGDGTTGDTNNLRLTPVQVVTGP